MTTLDKVLESVGQSRATFCQYIDQTLIPDLRASGRVETAKDFKTAMMIIKEQQKNY